MKGILVFFIASLILHPFASLMLFRKKRNTKRVNKIISFIALFLLLSFIFLSRIDITLTNDSIKFILISIIYFGACYLIWNVIYFNNKALKIMGIIISIPLFGLGIILGITGTGLLDNEETESVILKNIDDCQVTVYLFTTKPSKIHILYLDKHYGPFNKRILEKIYVNNFPENY